MFIRDGGWICELTLLTTVSRVVGIDVTVHFTALGTKLSSFVQIYCREMVLDSD